ncbi:MULTISPECIES: hypothetical protein [Yersinia pseudotuberculosis complex]|uniref:Uncharacterized protein n=1 Tax=Yersinia pseudotuberculosis TaxID=633 RepID=A0A380SBH4_YERPU|nr:MULTISPECIES: hypothetical protein [Yersinia pseudotuberculosis complex]SUQ39492.1 Uncharacterised protein [Yersinia pseudotuberculosis]
MYKNRCYMPFILFPPDMYDVPDTKSDNQLIQSLDLESDGTDFVMYLSIPYCRVCCKACPYFVDLLPMNNGEKQELLESDKHSKVTDCAYPTVVLKCLSRVCEES